jgi:hypothetical protein
LLATPTNLLFFLSLSLFTTTASYSTLGDEGSGNSFEKVLERILSSVNLDHRQDLNAQMSMPLKERDIGEAIKVIDANVTNHMTSTRVSKEHFQFIICGGTAGIGLILRTLRIGNLTVVCYANDLL